VIARWAFVFCVAGGPAVAGWTCVLTQTPCETDCRAVYVSFHVDPHQFVAPNDPNEPPRRQVTHVTFDRSHFVAEAILMQSGDEGFFEDAGALGSKLMIVRPDGEARLTLQPENQVLSGQCTRTP